MKISSVKVLLSGNGLSGNGSVKASVSITINNSFIMRGLTIVKKKNSDRLIVMMPVRRKPNGQLHEFFHPINKETRKYLTDTVLDAYHKVLADPSHNIIWYDQDKTLPTITGIQIAPIKGDRLVLALVSVLLDGAFVLNQIRVIHDPKTNKTWIAMPAKKILNDESKEANREDTIYLEYFHPVTKEFRQSITDQILAKYKASMLDEQAV